MAPLRVVDSVDSTHDRLLDDLRRGAALPGDALLALQQTAGHGRRGRPWRGGRGDTLMLSVVVGPVDPRTAPSLSPVAALAVLDLVTEMVGAERCRWKWPNDVLIDERKVAGLLLALGAAKQLRESPVNTWCAVVSLGLNRRPPGGSWPDDLRPGAVSLFEALGDGGQAPEPCEELGRRFLAKLEQRVEAWRGGVHLPTLLEPYMRIGRRVAVEQGTKRRTGQVAGLDELGRLLLKSGSEILRISAGDVFEL